MTRKLVLVLGFFLVFGFITDDCYAQASGNEQRLVGTWVIETVAANFDFMSAFDFLISAVVTFNQNGTLLAILEDERIQGRWGVAENQIVLTFSAFEQRFSLGGEFYISGDGRTMILVSDDIGRLLLRKR